MGPHPPALTKPGLIAEVRREDPLRWILGLLVAWLLVVVLPFWLDDTGHASRNDAAVWWAAGVMAYSGIRLAVVVAVGRARVLSFTFWAFGYVWLGLAPFLQLRSDNFPLLSRFVEGNLGRRHELMALAIVIVGLVGYEVGLFLAGSVGRTLSLRAGRAINFRRVRLLAWAGLVAMVVMLAWIGGPAALFSSRSSFASVLGFGGDGSIVPTLKRVALQFPVFVALLLLLIERYHGRRAPRQLGERVLFWLIVMANILVNNFVVNPRFWFGLVVLALMFSGARGYSPSRTRTLMVGTTLVLIVALPYADAYRYETSPSISVGPVRDPILNKADYAMYAQIQMTSLYVEQEGHTFGSQLLAAAAFFVPRSVWNQKPPHSGDLITEGVGLPERLNPSAPLWAEFFVDGGFGLVLTGFLLYGFVQRKLEDLYLDPASSPVSAVSAVVPLLAGYQIFFVRGPLLGVVPRLVALLLLLWLCVDTGDDATLPADEYLPEPAPTGSS